MPRNLLLFVISAVIVLCAGSATVATAKNSATNTAAPSAAIFESFNDTLVLQVSGLEPGDVYDSVGTFKYDEEDEYGDYRFSTNSQTVRSNGTVVFVTGKNLANPYCEPGEVTWYLHEPGNEYEDMTTEYCGHISATIRLEDC